jgi:hypothetical protein
MFADAELKAHVERKVTHSEKRRQNFRQFSKNNRIKVRTLSFLVGANGILKNIYRKLAKISAPEWMKRLDVLPIFREYSDVRKIGRNLAENGFFYRHQHMLLPYHVSTLLEPF